MLLLAIAAIVAQPGTAPQGASSGASVQAVATVRVISGARLNFGTSQNDATVPRPRLTTIHTADFQGQPAQLFEFQ